MQQVRIICNKLRLMCNKLCITYNYLPVYNTYSCRSRSKKAKPSTAAPAAATIAETMLAAVLNGTDIEKKVLLCVRNIKLQLLSIQCALAWMNASACLPAPVPATTTTRMTVATAAATARLTPSTIEDLEVVDVPARRSIYGYGDYDDIPNGFQATAMILDGDSHTTLNKRENGNLIGENQWPWFTVNFVNIRPGMPFCM